MKAPLAPDLTAEAERSARLVEIVAEIQAAQVSSIRLVGERLAEAREIFRYDRNEGGFTGWIEANLSFSASTAYRMIDVHQNIGTEMFPELGKLSRDAIFALAETSTPEAVRTEVAQRAGAGESFTAAEIRAKRTEANRR